MPSAAVQPRRRSRRFSLIEVVLGLGLIAFGLISMAALFPVGLRANQAAVGETYAAEHADQFLHLFKARISAPDNGQANWATYAVGLPTSKPLGTEPASGWSAWLQQGLVTYETAGGSGEFHRLRQWAYTEVEKVEEEERVVLKDIQFSAVCRVWRTPVNLTRYDGGAWSTINFSADDAVALNVEISWPSDRPYASRQKALYQLEVYRPQL